MYHHTLCHLPHRNVYMHSTHTYARIESERCGLNHFAGSVRGTLIGFSKWRKKKNIEKENDENWIITTNILCVCGDDLQFCASISLQCYTLHIYMCVWLSSIEHVFPFWLKPVFVVENSILCVFWWAEHMPHKHKMEPMVWLFAS